MPEGEKRKNELTTSIQNKTVQINRYVYIGSLALCIDCLPMIRETWVQSQVASYQRLLKWYLIPPCLTLSNIRHISKVKWSNPSLRLGVVAIGHPPTTVANFSLLNIYIEREGLCVCLKRKNKN